VISFLSNIADVFLRDGAPPLSPNVAGPGKTFPLFHYLDVPVNFTHRRHVIIHARAVQGSGVVAGAGCCEEGARHCFSLSFSKFWAVRKLSKSFLSENFCPKMQNLKAKIPI